jgi:hypothetical protein
LELLLAEETGAGKSLLLSLLLKALLNKPGSSTTLLLLIVLLWEWGAGLELVFWTTGAVAKPKVCVSGVALATLSTLLHGGELLVLPSLERGRRCCSSLA